jgi:hypothetical protein
MNIQKSAVPIILAGLVMVFFFAGCSGNGGSGKCAVNSDCDLADLEFCDPADHKCKACQPDCSETVCGPDPVCGSSCGDCDRMVLANGGFEMSVENGVEHPPFWDLGYRTLPLPSGTYIWSLDPVEAAEGNLSLKMETSENFFFSQVLHLPGALLEGRQVSFSLQARHEGTAEPPVFFIAGYNPEVTEADPILGPGLAGSAIVQADPEKGVWKEYSGSFTATAPATAVALILGAFGAGGTVWYDDVRVQADPWLPGAGPDPAGVEVPLTARAFDTGFVSESPMDISDLGYENLLENTAAAGSVLNIFFHVRWCRHRLSATPCAEDYPHFLNLEYGRKARARGLKLALTLDFTHGSAEGIGNLNPLPDGSSPGTLPDPEVRTAYQEEILWLFDQLEPEYVLVGVEVDIMYGKHPEWWDAYLEMEGEIYDLLKRRNPAAHVTAYHTLAWSVAEDGTLREEAARVWRRLIPKIDSIAFSTYPNVSLDPDPPRTFPPGYFSRPREIAPELPILVPEFGAAGGGDTGFSESEQAGILRQMLTEFAAADPAALIWYSLYDQTYLGSPSWFKQAFRYLGMRDFSGTPKEVFILWKKVHELPEE